MRIVCPSCGVAYQVPAALLAKRHTLKCSACGVKWRVELPVEEAAPPPAPSVEQNAVTARAPAPPPEGGLTPPKPDVPAPEAAPPVSSPQPVPESEAVPSAPTEAAVTEAPAPSSAEAFEKLFGTPASSGAAPSQPAEPVEREEAGAEEPEPAEQHFASQTEADESVKQGEDASLAHPPEPEKSEPALQDGAASPVEAQVEEKEEPSAQPVSSVASPWPAPAWGKPQTEKKVFVEEKPEAKKPDVPLPAEEQVSQSLPEAPQSEAIRPETSESVEQVAPVASPAPEAPSGPVSSETAANEEIAGGEAAGERVVEEQTTAEPQVETATAQTQPEQTVREPESATQQHTHKLQAGMSSAYQQVLATGAGLAERVGTKGNLRDMMTQDIFWRRAWIGSFILAIVVLVAGWHWWGAIVHAWPAAGRLHQPG
ncbi:hypothetical protein AD948_13825 [Acetobacter senegalensis]|uniref:Uncharacterized protein n=1 Tax=Acetobacter senegalensis TaxID=446692 RepID=A0A149TWW7_9PROT|nr:zinc-ribbon domain-containing protein [Acetobacter senegalensis]KXV57597.1 hypothetical protein AD948_13825 [Acetobacter senegalensis]